MDQTTHHRRLRQLAAHASPARSRTLVRPHTVLVKIGPQGTGRKQVTQDPATIQRVVVLDYHGTPHVHPASNPPGSAWIEVLGAEPDTELTVSYDVSG